MVAQIRLEEPGGAQTMRFVQSAQVDPGPGEVWLEQAAVGVNYLDVMQRSGAVAIPMPTGLGLEGAGRVVSVGQNVGPIKAGDRVVYALGPIGSYAEGRLYPAERLIKLPDAISCEEAAAVLFKGLTAQYLVKSTYRVTSDTVVLLYGAAGGLGTILAAWATHLGARVLGVVSKPDSVERARAAGCAEVFIWNDDLPAQVEKSTGGGMADVVYDGVGRTTFEASLASLKVRGMMVSIGASSGLPDPVSIPTLNKKSLFLTRPSLAAHISDPAEYQARAADVLDALLHGIIKPSIWKSFPLAQAAAAHEAIESGASKGTILLKP